MPTVSILLVDDDKDLREVLSEALELEGYAVTSAENGLEALKHLRSTVAALPQPCLILLDLMMPVMDGRAFRDELLKDPKLMGIPVVLITAGGHQLASTVVANGILHKPLRMETLLKVIRDCCPPAVPAA